MESAIECLNTLALSTHSKPCIICDIVNHYYRRSADVHITVKDVNEFIPEWSQEEYSGQVEEGEIAEVILQVPNTRLLMVNDTHRLLVQVQADDKDCSPTFGEVCSYSITAPSQPFSVSPAGVIRNTVPLSASESRSHVLSVVATDCGGKESSPVLVTITVTPRCSTAWSGEQLTCHDAESVSASDNKFPL